MVMDISVTKTLIFSSLLLIGTLIGVGPAMAVEVGDPAPDFKLPSTTGKPISLSQFKGKKNILLQFYTLDFNPV